MQGCSADALPQICRGIASPATARLAASGKRAGASGPAIGSAKHPSIALYLPRIQLSAAAAGRRQARVLVQGQSCEPQHWR